MATADYAEKVKQETAKLFIKSEKMRLHNGYGFLASRFAVKSSCAACE
jgi:hypothetical protein